MPTGERAKPGADRPTKPLADSRDTAINLGESEIEIDEGVEVAPAEPVAATTPTLPTAPVREPPPEIGTTIGSYKVLSLIGTGGMANVFLAEHIQLGRKVALKKLHPQFAEKKDMVQRFFQEAKTVNRISHDHIIQVTDFVETPAGDVCYIMELLDGSSLEEVLRSEGPMPFERAVRLAIQAVDALVAVHKTGIIHRDLKPANIFLVRKEDGRDFVKLLDFGISKVIYDAQALAGKGNETQAGIILGTPRYMAPEQAEARPVDARTDVYAFGIILYELLCGMNPFAAKSTIEVLSNQLHLEPGPPSMSGTPVEPIPAAMDGIILTCLAKDPAERFQSMQELVDALRELLPDEVAFTSTSPTVPIPRAPSGSRKLSPATQERLRRMSTPAPVPTSSKRGIFIAGGIVGVAVLGLGGFFFVYKMVAPIPPASATPGTGPGVEGSSPAAPAVVEVSFVTHPAGAAATVSETGEVLGTTPFSKVLPRAAKPITVDFRLEGYKATSADLQLTKDVQLTVDLERAAREPRGPVKKPPKKAPKRPGVERSGTVNPFE